MTSATGAKKDPPRGESTSQNSARPSDPCASAPRVAGVTSAERRASRISAGVDELDRWLVDLVRGGLAAAQARPYAFWDAAAARLVDAQAPGLASRVRRMGGLAHSGDGWAERVLAEAGRLRLAVRAWPRRASLSPSLQADLRTVVGWSWKSEEVLATGSRVSDRWVVAGVLTREEERLTVRRTWLRGVASGRPALVLEFSHRGGFESAWVTGTIFEGELCFYPGGAPLRALVTRVRGTPVAVASLPADPVDHALASFAAAVGANPWTDRWLLSVRELVPLPGRALLGTEPSARLVAFAGGAPVSVAGEWDGRRFSPLSASDGTRVVAL